MANRRTLRTCPHGHTFYKSSDCLTCPTCEAGAQQAATGFLAQLSGPARRALAHEGISTPAQLSTYTEREILALHGMGPASLPKLRAALAEKGLTFRK